ncbi:MAG: YhgE/Pip domain-containing protein [Lachnospiraceae bacterium]|nr:YhgE/Pip domain-containing protein [Lachnospiraceae bacterium]
MKNILKIFLVDVKRISSNVVALVFIMGLSVLPSLYAWFNILSNWDPYGPEATSRMQIAVCSDDMGAEVESVKVNIGDSVVEGLKSNNTIGWVFTDTSEEALAGVNSGEYYAALIIPETFTSDMMSFMNGDVNHGQIEYYENEKKNAIAPKITAKAQQAVKEQVNATFVSTLTESMVEVGNVLSASEQQTGITLLDALLEQMNELDRELSIYITMLDSFINIIHSAGSLLSTTQVMLPNLDSIVDNGQSTVSTLEGALIAADGSARAASRLLTVSLDTVDQSLTSLSGSISSQLSMIRSGVQAPETIAQYAAIAEGLQHSIDINTALSSLGNVVSADVKQRITNEYNTVESTFATLTADLKAIAATGAKTEQDIASLAAKINGEIENCRAAVKALRDDYTYNVQPRIDTMMDDMRVSMIGASDVLNSINGNFSDVAVVLQQYKDTMEDGNGSLQDSRNMAADMRETLEQYIDHIVSLSTDEEYQEIMEMLRTDPGLIGSFLSSPVAIETVEVYPIENYGSAMAPFYTILAIWVGALILVAIMHVKVEPDKELHNVKHYQAYFGRYLMFFIVGQLQTLLIVLGNFFFIGIQCKEPFLFWLACSFISFVFTLMMYSLTVAFGNVGEAVAVVIMVLQVAGAGGTFPIEVLPEIYQKLYLYLPFTYGLRAMKECVAGMYGMDYVISLLWLSVFALVSLLIGLVLAIPCRRLNEKIEESKAKTGIML